VLLSAGKLPCEPCACPGKHRLPVPWTRDRLRDEGTRS